MPTDRDIVIAAKLRSGKKLTSSELAQLQLQRERAQKAQWTACQNPQVHDIIRWSEDVLDHECGNDDKAKASGRRIVTAQVVGRDVEKLSLYVLSHEWVVTPEKAAPLKTGERLRRPILAVKSGDCCRLVRE